MASIGSSTPVPLKIEADAEIIGTVEYDRDSNITNLRHTRSDLSKRVALFFLPRKLTDKVGIFSTDPETKLREMILHAQKIYEVWLVTGVVEDYRDLAVRMHRNQRRLGLFCFPMHGNPKQIRCGLGDDIRGRTNIISIENMNKPPVSVLFDALAGMIDKARPDASTGILLACSTDARIKNTLAETIVKRLGITIQCSCVPVYPANIDVVSLEPFRIIARDPEGQNLMGTLKYDPTAQQLDRESPLLRYAYTPSPTKPRPVAPRQPTIQPRQLFSTPPLAPSVPIPPALPPPRLTTPVSFSYRSEPMPRRVFRTILSLSSGSPSPLSPSIIRPVAIRPPKRNGSEIDNASPQKRART